nr:PREDICTED: antigen-presenting glycoprotein CD1d-like isoform X1 [Apteryx mantelli mantelli]
MLPLLLLLLFLVPGSALEEPQLFQLFQTSIFPNTSSAEIAGRAVLGDVQIFSLDPATWNLDLSYPWVRQAIAESDAEKIESHYKIYMRNLVRYVRDVGRQAGLAYPLVIQIRAGCELSPNGTTRGFFDVAENGASLVAYEVGLQKWAAQQQSLLAEMVKTFLDKRKAISGLMDHILVISCKSHIHSLHKYGKETLERQVQPVAVVFARVPSPAHLLLVCRVTGFYPRPVRVDWLRDGQEVPPGPELNSTLTLPNADLTYQLRSVLAVTPHDGHSYACRVQHSSLGGRSLLVPWGRCWCGTGPRWLPPAPGSSLPRCCCLHPAARFSPSRFQRAPRRVRKPQSSSPC